MPLGMGNSIACSGRAGLAGLLERKAKWLFSSHGASNRWLLCTYYVLGILPGGWETSANKREKSLSLGASIMVGWVMGDK